MKKQATGLFIQMSTEQLENLTSVLNETLVTGFNSPKSKRLRQPIYGIFSARAEAGYREKHSLKLRPYNLHSVSYCIGRII
ncbi:MAG: hypothetical protein ABIQ31_19285 [Ferruginibacter sp.]